MTEERDPHTLRAKPVSALAEGPKVPPAEALARALGAERRILGAAFDPLKTRRQLFDGLENGAAASSPLMLIHAVYAVMALLAQAWSGALLHGMLTLAAILAYYAILHGRTVVPSVAVLVWTVVETAAGHILFGYPPGLALLNLLGVSAAVLAVRATWRRSRPG